MSEADNGPVDSVDDHAGESSDYGQDYANGNEPSCESSVLSLMLEAEHLIGVKKIPHLYQFADIRYNAHRRISIVSIILL